MNKKMFTFGISLLTIIGVILLSYIFSEKDILSIQKDFKDLSVNEVIQIEIERIVNDKVGGTTTNVTVNDKDDIEKIISTMNSTKLKTDFNQYNGGALYDINIVKENKEIINIVFNQGFIFDTKYRLQGNELIDLFNSMLN